MKPTDIDDIIKFIKNYLTDNNSAVKMSIPSEKKLDLLNIIKNQLNANIYTKNSLLYENIIIYIYHRDLCWNINIKNIDLMEPTGPI
jgi:hypothetical protein